MELDDVLGPPLLPLVPGEEHRAEALRPPRRSRTAQCASVSIRRHWLKITTLRPCVDDELGQQLAQLEQLRAREGPRSALGRARERDRGPDLLEAELGQAVGDDPLRGEQRHQPEELRLGERPSLGPAASCAIGWLSASCSLHAARRSSRPGRGCRCAAGAGSSTSWRTRRTMQAGQPLAERVEVPRADDLAAARRPNVAWHGGRAATSARAPGRRPTRRSRPAPRAGSPSACRSGRGDRAGSSPFTEAAVLVAQFLIRCASSSTTRSGCEPRTSGRSRSSCS